MIFALLRGHRAVAAAFLIAWLFLPMFAYRISGAPDYTKVSATTVGVFLAVLLLDSAKLLQFRPRWFDLPMLLWCLWPFGSSLSNDLGAYDGLSEMVKQIVTWGLPYFIGRLYFGDLASLRDLATGVALGGLVYAPLCLFEIKMSPQLHTWVYGFHQHDFRQAVRGDLWRPTVFMQHGLAVGTFMASAALASFWLWYSGSVRKLFNIPMVWVFGVILVTTALTRSALAVALLAAGIGALLLLKHGRMRVAIACMAMVPFVYVGLRTAGGWSGQELLDVSTMTMGEGRATSLHTRLYSEDVLWSRASQRPLFGWGGWGRNMEYDRETYLSLAIPDGLWIIIAGTNGMAGLAMFAAAMLAGVWRMFRNARAWQWRHPAMAGAVTMAMLLIIHMCDNLLNAMINPIFVLGAGGLAGLVYRSARTAPRPQSVPMAQQGARAEDPLQEGAARPVTQ
jgi:O-antigen ligase